ncbi:terpenoid synthase [Phanerochaete sordida]|uniref:Terpenoid synthase n=1 Tax=Phanerochaete sordida TaxID=48140 RepID=A0A9P3GPV9_9APHY|nr:terpenoid synthase [Phanerochaete sordida]
MSGPSSYQIPDLPALFLPHFKLRTNTHCRAATADALAWAASAGFLSARERERLPGLRLGLLAALCLPTADHPQVVRAAQFLALLVHWWDRGVGEGSRKTWAGLWAQFCRTTSKAWQARFQEHLAAFEAANLDSGKSAETLMSVDAYMAWARRSSGFAMGLALVEYAEGLDLPEDVSAARPLAQLREVTVDLMIWIHEIASYNTQQAADDPYNVVSVLSTENGISLQAAMRRAGERVKELIAQFLVHEATLAQCSWGPYTDRDVRVYVVGLRDGAVGTAHWVYECERYFMGKGEDVKAFGWVFLLPKESDEDEEGGEA